MEACPSASASKLYRMRLRTAISRTTLADTYEARDWRVYAEFAQALIRSARPLYAEDNFGVKLPNTVYALDATMINLGLSVFP